MPGSGTKASLVKVQESMLISDFPDKPRHLVCVVWVHLCNWFKIDTYLEVVCKKSLVKIILVNVMVNFPVTNKDDGHITDVYAISLETVQLETKVTPKGVLNLDLAILKRVFERPPCTGC